MNELIYLIILCLFGIIRNCQEIVNEGKNSSTIYNILIEGTACIVCFIQLLRG